MSITSQRKLDELQAQCVELGLEVTQTGKRITKTDYILALRDYYLNQKFEGNIPKYYQLLLKLDSPMLCNRINNFTPERQEEIWNSDRFIAEQKEDGVRLLMIWDKGKFHFFSRNNSVDDFLPISYDENIYLGIEWDCESVKYKEDIIIFDAEVVSNNPNIDTALYNAKGVVTESQLQAVASLLQLNPESTIKLQIEEGCPLEFKVFDCLYYNEWLTDKPLIERIEIMDKLYKEFQSNGLKITRPKSSYKNKKAFFKAIISQGCEGVVLKDIYSTYLSDNTRTKSGWIKAKRTMSQSSAMDGLSDTIDAFVTGFTPATEDKGNAGMVGALIFSVLLDKGDCSDPQIKEIARISGISQELREEITEKDENGEPRLKKEWYNKVASLDGQCISARSKRLKHAVLVDWRPDRSPDTCVMTESFINSMIL